MSRANLDRATADLVESGLILSPSGDVLQLAQDAISRAEPEFIEELGRALMIGYFVREFRAAKLRLSRQSKTQMVLPGCEHLPVTITGKRNLRVKLLDATYSDLLRYYNLLSKKHTDRKKHDARLSEAKALIKRMHKAAHERPGITVRKVLGIGEP